MKKLSIFLIPLLLLILSLQTGKSQNTVTVTIDLSNSMIGMERSGAPTIPAPNEPDYSAYSWTCGGLPCIGRTLMSVDLSQVPANATIVDARLSLYADPVCTYLGYYGQPTYGVKNRGVIMRITSPWNPNTVTWNNPATTTNANQGKIHTSSSVLEDYTNLDVTALIQDMIDYPSYGLKMQMSDEVNHYKSLIFGSNLNPDESLQPQLVVTYTVENGAKNNSLPKAVARVDVYPNPATDKVIFEFSNLVADDQVNLSIYNVDGRLIQNVIVPAFGAYAMNISEMNPGMYFYRTENNSSHETTAGKFVKQ